MNSPDDMKSIFNEEGKMTKEILGFKQNVTTAILNGTTDLLYELSEQSMDRNTFNAYYKSTLGKDIDDFYQVPETDRGISINVDQNVGPVIGSLVIVGYQRTHCTDDDSEEIYSADIVQFFSRLYFRTIDDEYRLISVFNKLQMVNDQESDTK